MIFLSSLNTRCKMGFLKGLCKSYARDRRFQTQRRRWAQDGSGTQQGTSDENGAQQRKNVTHLRNYRNRGCVPLNAIVIMSTMHKDYVQKVSNILKWLCIFSVLTRFALQVSLLVDRYRVIKIHFPFYTVTGRYPLSQSVRNQFLLRSRKLKRTETRTLGRKATSWL